MMPRSTTCLARDLTPTQRREQVAAILARGLLRILQQARSTDESAPETLEFPAGGLEVSGESRLSVSRVSEVNRTTNQRGTR